MSENTKQIIVIRKDLNMRKGKMCAQASHASMAFLTKGGRIFHSIEYGVRQYDLFEFINGDPLMKANFEEINHWLNHSFRKIVCYVNGAQELIDLHQKALDKGLISHMVEDNGATEFNGVLTKTCIAIGPHWEDKFEGLTDNLPLL